MKIFILMLAFIVGAHSVEVPILSKLIEKSAERITPVRDFITLLHVVSLVHLHPNKLEDEAYMNSVSITFTNLKISLLDESLIDMTCDFAEL